MSDVTPEVLARLRAVRPADASDALDSLGHIDTYSMDTELRPLAFGQRMVGLAQTYQLVPSDRVPSEMPYAEYNERLREFADGWGRFSEMFGPDGVSVIDALGTRAGVLGSANTLSGKIKGMQGYVIDGSCRDSHETILQKIPVWCRRRSFSRVEWRIKCGRFNETVMCGGVRVRPGDVVMGDDDGVLVIPAELAEEVATRALDILERDKRSRRRMYEQLGIPLDDTVQ